MDSPTIKISTIEYPYGFQGAYLIVDGEAILCGVFDIEKQKWVDLERLPIRFFNGEELTGNT